MDRSTNEPLTPRQENRQTALLRAAVSLAETGGYEAVQMREVASTADVALGTLYNYFSSKDHLLAAVMVSRLEVLGRMLRENPPEGSDARSRVVHLMTSATDSMGIVPNVTKAMVTALNSPGSEVAECKERLSVIMNSIISEALAPDITGDMSERMARSIEHVWFSTLLAWVNGWMDAKQVQEELLDAVRFIVPS